MALIKKYSSFLEAFSFFKKQAPYLFSNRLRTILKSLRGDYYVADVILFSENMTKVVDDITLIDIGEDEETLTFIQVNRLTRFHDEEGTGDDFVSWLIGKWNGSDESLDFKGWTQQRTSISIGRFLNRLLTKTNYKVSDVDKEKFVNAYKTRWKISKNATDNFELVSGDVIKKWYLENSYQYRKGQLSNSCMRYDRCQEYFDIYTKNPEVCQLLILHGDDRETIIGRALVWKLSDPEGKFYMDRIYTNLDADQGLFIEYAEKNNWLRYQRTREVLYVKLKELDYQKFPYMDTFVCYNPITHELSNNEDLWPGGDWWYLQNTEGGYTIGDVVYSSWHDCYITMDEAVWCQDVEDHLRRDEAIYLSYKDKYVSPDAEVCHSDFDGENYYLEDCVYSEKFGLFIYSDKAESVIINKMGDVDFVPIDWKDKYFEIELMGDKVFVFKDEVFQNPANSSQWIFWEDLYSIKEDILKFGTPNQQELISYLRDLKINEGIIADFEKDLYKIWRFNSIKLTSDELSKLLKFLIWSKMTSTFLRELLNQEEYIDLINDLFFTQKLKHHLELGLDSYRLKLKTLSEQYINSVIKDPKMLAWFINLKYHLSK